MKRFLSIGECMVELADIGEGRYRRGFAGDTFNAAWYARRSLAGDWQVNYFTAVGDEAISQHMLDFMESQGVSTGFVRRIAGRMPGLYMIELKNGERSFAYWRDTSAARSLADDAENLEQAVTAVDAIFFSGITLAILAPEARERLLAALARARRAGKLVAFDSNIRMRLWRDAALARTAITSAAQVVNLALPTGEDEASLFGDADGSATARRYLQAGVEEVVVKNGADDALLCWPGGTARIGPEHRVTPIDTTGAGDSFCGTYLAARLTGSPPPDAARRAHHVASQVVMAPGALVSVA